MRIPKGILKIAVVSARENTRYAFNGVFLEREKDQLRATATDGHKLVTVTWPDENSVPLPCGLEEADKSVENFKAIVPSSAALMVDANIPQRGGGEVAVAVIDEAATNGMVKLATRDNFKALTIRTEVAAIDGQFPPFRDVIPTYQIVDDADKSKAVSVSVDACHLRALLNALLEAVPGDLEPRVVMEIPLAPGRVVKLTRKNIDGREAIAVLMTLNPR